SDTPASAERCRTLRNRLRGGRYPGLGCEGANTPDSLERGRTAASRLWPVRCRPRPGPNPCRSTTRSAMVRRLGQRWFGGSVSGGSRIGLRLPQGARTARTEVTSRVLNGDGSTESWKPCLHTELCVAERAVGRIRPSARGSAAARVSRSSGKQPIEVRRTLVRNQAGQGSLCCFDGCQEAGLCWGGTL